MADFVPPEWVLQRYNVHERIGAGRYTEVFRATDKVRGDPFAIKVLLPEHKGVPRIRDRFVTEAKAMTRVVHPNIIRIFDVGGALSDEPAIVMEYAAGGDLKKLVPHGGLEPGLAGRLMLFTLAGLAEAHSVGITHRGLCPEAVLLDIEHNPKISDFGVARLERHRKLTTTLSVESLGSLFFTSPEQRARAYDADSRSDVYAAGSLLYFLVTGRDPPDLSEAAEAPALLSPVHPALRPIILKATRAERGDRYQDAREMGKALRGLYGTR